MFAPNNDIKSVLRNTNILVFDTIALLSADDRNPVQVWRNNEDLGICCIPGACFNEIDKIAKSYVGKNSKSTKNNRNIRNKDKADKFLRFISRGGSYEILGNEDNPNIPIGADTRRQILACAHKMAMDYPDRVVILVTYDVSQMALVARARLDNFCMIEAKEIARWYHKGSFTDELPEAIDKAYKRMGITPFNTQRLSGGRNQMHQLPETSRKKRSLPESNRRGGRDLSGDSSAITVESNSVSNINYQRHPTNGRRIGSKKTSTKSIPAKVATTEEVFKNRKLIVATIALISILTVALIPLFLNRKNSSSEIDPDTGIVILQEATDETSQPAPPTSAKILALADNGILDFQQTQNSESLLRPINELQELKNLQAGKLDPGGEEKLSKLKHKYAIEVLASRSQVKKAIELLEEVPTTYTDYSAVEAWLAKQ